MAEQTPNEAKLSRLLNTYVTNLGTAQLDIEIIKDDLALSQSHVEQLKERIKELEGGDKEGESTDSAD